MIGQGESARFRKSYYILGGYLAQWRILSQICRDGDAAQGNDRVVGELYSESVDLVPLMKTWKFELDRPIPQVLQDQMRWAVSNGRVDGGEFGGAMGVCCRFPHWFQWEQKEEIHSSSSSDNQDLRSKLELAVVLQQAGKDD